MEKTVIFTVIGLIAAGLIIAAVLLVAFWPKYEEQFLELGLLGKNKMAEDYFSNTESVVTVNSQVDWYLYVHNHMETSQNVTIKVKLLNSVMTIPNDQTNEPSPHASFTEFPLSLASNETSLLPFSWILTERDHRGGLVVIKRLTVNGESFSVNISTPSESFFRMVFELWVYNGTSQELEFGWTSGEELSSASLHIGFRVN